VHSGALEISAGVVGRFYGDGYCWAIDLPVNELLRRHELMPAVRRADPFDAAVWLRKPPGE
jgi:hypothetical protein